MFKRLLIANRGEIACRILRTCRRLGIFGVAVYSDADAGARHVAEADLALRIGPAPARESYLNVAAILEAARESGADAIHPGYGFLSEKLELIDACRDAGLTFVGPHREAIAAMGSKIESKRIARAAGVPCVPGYDADDQDAQTLAAEAERIGFPLLIKASAGGGGKGMRLVQQPSDFAVALVEARREALAAFGDDRVLLEKFIVRPRHLEVQLLGDRHGGLLHLFERECSIQRNYQKVVEEAPANHLPERQRARLFEAALQLGRAIGYDSTGTVEFVLDADAGDEPYFLEMNTRLQVEHGVTELVTGVDLVEQQLRSAAGLPLALTQDALHPTGWAIEVRVNAEAPAENFQASFGEITGYAEPEGVGVRVDSGVREGSVVPPHYDSMVGKLLAWGPDRRAAQSRLATAAAGYRLRGIETNLPLLLDILGHPAFNEKLDTRFLAERFPGGWRRSEPQEAEHRAVAAAAWLWSRSPPAEGAGPFARLSGFRLTGEAGQPAFVHLEVADGAGAVDCDLLVRGVGRVETATPVAGLVLEAAGPDKVQVAGADRSYRIRCQGEHVETWASGDWRVWRVRSQLAARASAAQSRLGGGDTVIAALPGVVSQIMVQPGDSVVEGQPLLVLEAMKLMHTLCAPRTGVVATVHAAEGATVSKGTELVTLEPISAEDAA